MLDMITMVNLETIRIEARAEAQGRKATSEEYTAGTRKACDAWMNAIVNRDMSAAGFVKSETGEWQSPRRGFWSRLFGGV